MVRQSTSLVVQDLSSFTRSLARSLAMATRRAGSRRAAEPDRACRRVHESAGAEGGAFGRAEGRQPARAVGQRAPHAVAVRCAGPDTEREINTILRSAHAFGDHVTLRRELVNHRLLARKADCSAYWKLPARPDDEVRSLLAAWRALRHAGPFLATPSDGRNRHHDNP